MILKAELIHIFIAWVILPNKTYLTVEKLENNPVSVTHRDSAKPEVPLQRSRGHPLHPALPSTHTELGLPTKACNPQQEQGERHSTTTALSPWSTGRSDGWKRPKKRKRVRTRRKAEQRTLHFPDKMKLIPKFIYQNTSIQEHRNKRNARVTGRYQAVVLLIDLFPCSITAGF